MERSGALSWALKDRRGMGEGTVGYRKASVGCRERKCAVSGTRYQPT